MAFQNIHVSSFLDEAVDRERRLGREREARLAAAAAEGRAGVFPEPDERPTPRAQWDEIHGRWMEWDDATDRWTVIEDVHGDVAPADDAAAVTDEAGFADAAASLDDIE
jgi:hypothetical protein